MTSISASVFITPETPITVTDLYKDRPGDTITVKFGPIVDCVTAFFSRDDLIRLHNAIGTYLNPDQDLPQ